MRGNPQPAAASVAPIGSIPAHAGEPPPGRCCRPNSGVYPRACGGTILSCQSDGSVGGLSPRMRGNQAADLQVLLDEGGEPSPSEPGAPWHRVYPRACGGTTVQIPASATKMGLSPRMRGNRDDDPRPRRMHGSIPAHAGEPAASRARHGRIGVYPRACGGTWWGELGPYTMPGLSPRMRGNPCGVVVGVPDHGSIPAHAGEPQAPQPTTDLWGVYPRACGGTPIG